MSTNAKKARPEPFSGPFGIMVLGAAAGLVLLVGLVLIEAWVRLARWTPRSQIVRGYGLHTVDGVPLWEVSNDRHNRACVEQNPHRTRVAFFGSSITYGVDVTPPEVFSSGLQARLDAGHPTPGVCVLNFAQPGFQFEQKYAVARREVPRYRPAVILWESWVEWRKLRMIGETAYAVSDYRVRPDGFIGVTGVPDRLNRILFRHSRLYEYLTLQYAPRVDHPAEREAMTAFVNTELIKMVRLAQSVDARLVIYVTPPLDRPFAQTVATPTQSEAVVLEFAQAQGVPSYLLARELIEEDYLQLRLSPCCHFNARGHAALVPVMERIVLSQLDGTAARDR